MHSKRENQIRVFGQRSIPSSFIFRSSNPGKDSKQDGQKENSKKKSCVSFSDFLDKKLDKKSVLPKIVKGKPRPFWSPLGHNNGGGSTDLKIEVQKEEGERSSVLDQLVFEQFKPTSVEKGDDLVSISDGEKGDGMGPFGEKRIASCSFGVGSSGDDKKRTSIAIGSSNVSEAGTSTVNGGQGTRKRRNAFGGGRRKHTTRKHSLVMGGRPNPNQQGRKDSFNCNKKQRPLYNHYATGSGWWDCDMEGVDSEEVGFGEIWEGVGSTTFGGIEWH